MQIQLKFWSRNPLGSLFLGFCLTCFLASCGNKSQVPVDLILHHGKVYTSDSAFAIFEAIAISGDSIVAIGSDKEILKSYAGNKSINLQGRAVYPGFIDAHCHFFAYGQDLQELNLKQTISFDDLINQTIDYFKKNNPSIIVGRGWNEEIWEIKSTPSKYKLDALFPETPVVLQRIDGHAVLCNQAALDLAQIDENTFIQGGHVVKMGDHLTGMLVDKAAELVLNLLPEISKGQKINALKSAEKACFKAGLTTVSDAGLDFADIDLIDSLQKSGDLKIRVYAMSNPSDADLDYWFEKGIQTGEQLVVRSVKLYADGSLGSRGALLKEPYCDDSLNYGLLQRPMSEYAELIKRCYENGFQVNTHCIGDSANALLLSAYAETLGGSNDLRWRIEHAQVVDPTDWHKFGDFNIIPSVQPTHATSDMYMAQDRLCDENRLKGAYSYNSLLKQNGMLAFGTDFPVEAIDPLNTYFSAVNRKGRQGDVFRIEEAVSHQEAIMSMTIWAAYANFMDTFIGSLEIGKKADLVILSHDPSLVNDRKSVKNEMTIANGEIVFNRGISIDNTEH